MDIKNFRSILAKGIMSGIMIGIGCVVFLMTSGENRYLGAFLFSFGLFTIIRYGFALYTGKVGYIPENKPSYILEVLVTLLGNIVGTGISSVLIMFTRIGDTVHENALAIMQTKLNDNVGSRFILGIFCGLLMYLAVENAKNCKKDGFDMSLVFGTVLPVMIFILAGFNHSVADCFYLFAAYPSADGVLYIITVALGNALGGMTVPLMKKLF